MKKLFAILAVMGVLTLGSVQPVMAQDAAPAQTEQTTEAAVVEEARLESVYTPKVYRGFESRSLRIAVKGQKVENN